MAVTEDLDIFDNLLKELKMFFDIILVDISHETSNFATEAAIKCNKVFMVCDESLKSTSNIVRSFNYITTLGVSLTKCKRVILNKSTAMHSGIQKMLSSLKLELFGEIPFSETIYNRGVAGKPFYAMATRDTTVTEAHILLKKIMDDILEVTPTNKHNIKGESEVVVDNNAKDIDVGTGVDNSIEPPKIKASEINIVMDDDDDEPTFQ